MLTRLTHPAVMLLKRDPNPSTGASRAHHESHTRIFKLEAPLFVGVGEGTDNLDSLADLSALRVIDPDEVAQAVPPEDRPVPKSDSPLLYRLKYEDLPYAYCAWCTETPKGACSRSTTMPFIMLCCNHLAAHLRQCSRPLWVRNYDCDKEISVPIRLIECSSGKEGSMMRLKDILGATCAVQDDKSKMWYVKMPQFIEGGDTSLLSPWLQLLDEDESDLNEYLDDPTDPVMCWNRIMMTIGPY